MSEPFISFSFALLVAFVGFVALSLIITVPLTGTLVRLRANHNPKGLQLDPEDGAQPHTGPIITSFFSMMFRVKRLEARIAYFLVVLRDTYVSRRAGLGCTRV